MRLLANSSQQQVGGAEENHNANDLAGRIDEKHDTGSPALRSPTIHAGHVPDGYVRQRSEHVIFRCSCAATDGFENEPGESPICDAGCELIGECKKAVSRLAAWTQI